MFFRKQPMPLQLKIGVVSICPSSGESKILELAEIPVSYVPLKMFPKSCKTWNKFLCKTAIIAESAPTFGVSWLLSHHAMSGTCTKEIGAVGLLNHTVMHATQKSSIIRHVAK